MHPRDLDRIRFVTRYFYALQGLNRAITGLLFLVCGLVAPGPINLAVLAVCGIPGIWLSSRARSYYRNHFGKVERQAVNPLGPRGQRIVAVVGLALWISVVALTLYEQNREIPFLARSPVAIGRCLLLGASAVGVGAWWRRGHCRWQAHYLVLGLLCLGLAAPADALGPIQRTLSRRAPTDGVLLLLGAYLLVTGLFDHLVLVRTMAQLPAAAPGAAPSAARAEAPR